MIIIIITKGYRLLRTKVQDNTVSTPPHSPSGNRGISKRIAQKPIRIDTDGPPGTIRLFLMGSYRGGCCLGSVGTT